MNKKCLILFYLMISLILTSCKSNTLIIDSSNSYNSNSDNLSNKKEKLVENINTHINYLTSKEFEGRLVDTKGNTRTQEYLIDYLTKLNISPYYETYYQEFVYKHLYIDNASLKIGDEELEYKKDYMISFVSKNKNSNIEGIINQTNDSNIALLDSLGEVQNSDKYELIISKIDRLKNITSSESIIQNQVSICVKDDVYDKIKQMENPKVNMTLNYRVSDRKDNNIIAKISNKEENSSAIVISAHFDHVGQIDDNLYPGAQDNASGVSTLLEIARIINENVELNSLKKDIIVAFFNCEEMGLLGSKDFAKKISEDYENVVNINLDCIGQENAVVDIRSEDVKDYINLDAFMSLLWVPRYTVGQYVSDHLSFNYGISLLSDLKDIHTVNDTQKNIDEKIIENICTLIPKFIMEEAYKEISIKNTVENINEIEEKKLSLGEYKFIELDGTVQKIEQNKFRTNDKELIKKQFDSAEIVDEFGYSSISIIYSVGEEDEYVNDYKLNEVYKRDSSKLTNENIESIILILEKDDDFDLTILIQKLDLKSNIYKEKKELLKNEHIELNGYDFTHTFDATFGNKFICVKEDENFGYVAQLQYFREENGILIDSFDEAVSQYFKFEINKFFDEIFGYWE